MKNFIAGMNRQRAYVLATAQSIANEAVAVINAALASAGNVSTTSTGYAGGLDYVPYNGFPATLHRGEAVLTAVEAEDWRNGKSDVNSAGITIIQNIESVPQTPVELAAATAAYFEQARWVI